MNVKVHGTGKLHAAGVLKVTSVKHAGFEGKTVTSSGCNLKYIHVVIFPSS